MHTFAIIFTIAGIVIFQMMAKDLFPNGGIKRTLAAGAVGAVCCVIGTFIDKRLQK